MTKQAILIAVEESADFCIANVPYARRDVEAFSRALSLHGFDEGDQTILIDDQATKSVIESKVTEVLKSLRKEDSLYFYYVGHGFSQRAKSFLTCHDTLESDWTGTSVDLAPILADMRAANCERIILFVDCHEIAIDVAADFGGLCENLQEWELESFGDDARHCLCFGACHTGEASHSSVSRRHGVWAYHVIEAFRGEAPMALERGILTAGSLQNYLQVEVPRTLRNESPHPDEQTPWTCGDSSEEVVLADVRQILEDRQESANKGSNFIAEMLFSVVNPVSLRSLSGWKKSHRVPDSYSETTESFVISCATRDLAEDLDKVYGRLKQSFKFKRRELTATEPEGGYGSIITPYFNYSVHVALNREQLDEVMWTHTVEAIKVPEQITSGAFANVFDGVFDTLKFALPIRVNIEDLIDAVEDATTPGLTIEYDRAATYCELQLSDVVGRVTVTAENLSIVHDHPQKTRQLMESFEIVRQLVDTHGVPLISFAGNAK